MANQSFKAGVANVYLPLPVTTALPTFSTLVFTASGATLTDSYFNTIQSNLDSTITYQVCLAPIGRNTETPGYSVGRASPSSGNLTITAGQVIEVNVAVGAWPANHDLGMIGVFLKQGSGDFKLVGFYRSRTDTTSTFVIDTLPLEAAESFTLTNLQASTNPLNQKALGDRAPLGWNWGFEITPTSQAVTLTQQANTSITFQPNTGADFSILSARPFNVDFQSMVNGEKALVQASAGAFSQITTAGGRNLQSSKFGMNTAQILFPGNSPLLIKQPIDPDTGVQTDVLMVGLLLQSQAELALAFSKTDPILVPFSFQTAALDALLNNQPTVYMTNNSA